MPVYHRTQRLQIFGEKPEIQKLYGSRYRMVVRCVAKNDTKAWYDDNKSQIFADFGSLYSAQMSVDGIDARTGEAYDDMVLVKNEATYTRSGEYVIIFTYETLTDSFVQETEDKVDFDLNGLKRLTRTIIAKDTVAYSSVVGTSTTGTSPLLTLAQVSEDQLEASEDGFKRIQEVWLESGTLSETIDNVGSQKAKVIETIGADPSTPSGYSLASKQESDFEGFQTNRFTFLKDNVELSRSEDKVGSQLAITTQVFNPTSDPTESGYSLARKEVSDVDGIPTKRFTFLKDNVVLSESEDKVGSQLAIVQEVFNGTPSTPSGYSIANTQESDVDGIPTKRYTFLKDNVILSESADKVGSQLAITQEVFNGTPVTPSGYSIASEQVSDVDGIPTKRYTFLKDDVQLSQTEDRVGSQLAISQQWFNPNANKTLAGYSLASKNTSDFEGIETVEYRFLKNNVELSRSEDLVGSQLAITTEVFNPTSDPTESGYSLAREEVSDVEGIPTKRYTFLKDNVELIRSNDYVGSQKAITREFFNPTSDPTESGYSLASQQQSDFEGIKTIRYVFLKEDVKLSASEDKVGSQNAITEQWFKPGASRDTKASYSVARTEVSDVEGIPTERYTFLKDNVELSRSEDKVGSQLAIVTEVFKPDADPTESGYSVARTEVSDVDGIPTKRFTFLKDNVKLSESEDKVGSQLATTQEWFNPTDDPTITDYIVANTQVSDVEGIPTKRFTFLKEDVELSRSEDKVGSQLAITTEVFKPTDDPTETGYSLARTEVSDVEGIPTKRFTFLKDNVELSRSSDLVGSQKAITVEIFKPDSDPTEAGYSVARTEVSDVDGIPTKRFTFLKNDVKLSASEDEIGSQNAITEQWFKPSALRDTKASYSLARKEESDVDGIPTERYTFLKDNVELSRSEDLVGSQKAIVTEVFKPDDDPTEGGYSLARTEVSDVDGIPTKRFTFLKNNVVLSVSEDKVGSQKAIVNEVFDPTSEAITGIDTSGTALAGYSEANRTESDYEGIKTIRVQFLKPSILSLQQDFNNGLKRVSVQAFGMTDTNVGGELAAITTSHELMSQTESDYEGIKTSTFQYQLDESFTEEYEVDGFKRIILKELSTSSIGVAAIGSAAPVSGPASGLFLASQKIDNGGVIKVRETVWIEAGVISITPMEEDGFSLAASYVYVTTNAPASSMTGLTTPNGSALPSTLTWYEPSIQNVEGYPTYTQKVVLKTVTTGGVKVHSVDKFFTVTEPGVMSTGGSFNSNAKSGAATRYPKALSQPSTYRKKAIVDVYLTNSNSITETEVAFTEEGVDWCSVGFDSFYTNDTESTASVSSSWRSFPQYLNSSGTTDSAYATRAGVYAAYANSYGAGDTAYNTTGIYRVELEKYTRAVDGTQLYLKTIVTF